LAGANFFRDPRLQRLIELALTNNPDLRVAMLNVDQMRSLYRVQRAALVPTAEINANGTRQRIAFGFAGNGGGRTYSQYNVSLGVAQYELDLFGRVRSLKQQALETYFATGEARRSAQIATCGRSGRGLSDGTRIDRAARPGPAGVGIGGRRI